MRLMCPPARTSCLRRLGILLKRKTARPSSTAGIARSCRLTAAYRLTSSSTVCPVFKTQIRTCTAMPMPSRIFRLHQMVSSTTYRTATSCRVAQHRRAIGAMRRQWPFSILHRRTEIRTFPIRTRKLPGRSTPSAGRTLSTTLFQRPSSPWP